MHDLIVRAVAKEARIRIIVCETTALSEEGAQRHATFRTATGALSQALTSVAVLGALLKNQHRIALKWVGDGALGKVVVEGDAYGRVRGYVAEGMVAEGEDDEAVRKGIGRNGHFVVIKDLLLKELSESTVELGEGGLGADVTRYLIESEQTPSFFHASVRLGNDGEVVGAGGLFVQALGDAGAEAVTLLQARAKTLPSLADTLAEGGTPQQFMALWLEDIPYKILEERPVQFACNCSRERSERALLSLGKAELTQLQAEGEASVDCHYCHERYLFSADDLAQLLSRASF